MTLTHNFNELDLSAINPTSVCSSPFEEAAAPATNPTAVGESTKPRISFDDKSSPPRMPFPQRLDCWGLATLLQIPLVARKATSVPSETRVLVPPQVSLGYEPNEMLFLQPASKLLYPTLAEAPRISDRSGLLPATSLPTLQQDAPVLALCTRSPQTETHA